MSEGYWREVWESKAAEADFAASGRSSGDPGQLFALLADAATALELNPTDRLLDLGCGVGLLARHLRPYVARLVGVDFAVSLLLRAREHTPTSGYAAASLQALPFRDATFTTVLASSVLQYLGDDVSVAQALREMRRLVAPGGRAFASGNPDRRKKDEYIGGIDRLDLPEERKEQIRERNRKAYWLSPDVLAAQGEEAGWRVEVRPLASSVWQSFYMFDLKLIAR